MPDSVLQNYIDGQFVDSLSLKSSEPIDLISPVDKTVIGRAPVSNAEDVNAAVVATERAFASWGKTTPSVLQQALLKLADAIEAHSEEIVEAQCRNTGQPKAVIAAEEVAVSADQVRFFAGAARLVEGKSAGEYLEGFTSYVRREPIGVVGQVTPWNYPFMMAIWKIGPVLAAGNTIVLKPSDTPARLEGRQRQCPQRDRDRAGLQAGARGRHPVDVRSVLPGAGPLPRDRAHPLGDPNSPDERWPAGEFVTQSKEDHGLPVWTEGNRSIENTDVVLWYVFGIHHVTRPEDWPIMPVDTVNFWLKPVGFFIRNPSLDVAPAPPKSCHAPGHQEASP